MTKYRSTFSKHSLLLGTVLATFAMLVTGLSIVAAQQPSNIGPNKNQQVTLKQQLTAGLKAFTKADKIFINKVVKLVETGKLPRNLVDSTFLWSRDRAARRSYTRRLRPMVYFQPALVLRAKRIGVKL